MRLAFSLFDLNEYLTLRNLSIETSNHQESHSIQTRGEEKEYCQKEKR